MYRHLLQLAGVTLLLGVALAASFLAASYVEQSAAAQSLVERFGYIGMLVVTIVTGLNVFVPIPAATFTPIYEAAGFSLPSIIAVLVIGTLIADIIGYFIGVGGRQLAEERYQGLERRLTRFATQHGRYVPLLTFLWVAFMPLPNEFVVIPLGVVGIPFRSLILPLILGNIVHQTLLTFGATALFGLLF